MKSDDECKALIVEATREDLRLRPIEKVMVDLAVALSERLELKKKWIKAEYETEQTLGRALGYPWYKDDQKNFPGATVRDGVCTGDHVAVTLASEAADKIKELEEELRDAVLDRRGF